MTSTERLQPAKARSKWLRALRDPAIARVLALLHERPGESWTVAALANDIAASRPGAIDGSPGRPEPRGGTLR